MCPSRDWFIKALTTTGCLSVNNSLPILNPRVKAPFLDDLTRSGLPTFSGPVSENLHLQLQLSTTNPYTVPTQRPLQPPSECDEAACRSRLPHTAVFSSTSVLTHCPVGDVSSLFPLDSRTLSHLRQPCPQLPSCGEPLSRPRLYTTPFSDPFPCLHRFSVFMLLASFSSHGHSFC